MGNVSERVYNSTFLTSTKLGAARKDKMELDCQHADGTTIDSQDCNQSSNHKIKVQFASSDDSFDKDGELVSEEVISIRSKSRSKASSTGGRRRSASMKTAKQANEELKKISMKHVHESANAKVAGGYDALYMAFNAKKQIKPKPKYLTTPVAHNIKDNHAIRKSVIADYLNRRRSSQSSQGSEVLNLNAIRRQSPNGKQFDPNAFRRQSFIEQKSPNVFRKSFLEVSNPMYIKALPTDIQKSFAGTTDIKWNIKPQLNQLRARVWL